MLKYLLIFLLASAPLSAQKVTVYLLGTYHMGGTSDALKVDAAGDDILGPKRQQELAALLDRLEKTNAEKIYVESLPKEQGYWDSVYRLHYGGKTLAVRNEIYQIGLKLAFRLGLSQGVKCVDWSHSEGTLQSDLLFSDYNTKMKFLEDSRQEGRENEVSGFERRVLRELDDFNSRIPGTDLTSVLTTMNSESFLQKLFYINITIFLDRDDDGLGVFRSQYNTMRNAGIYSNIIRDILKDRPQSVLVLFGAGHIHALKDMLKAHPAIEVVDINTLLGG